MKFGIVTSAGSIHEYIAMATEAEAHGWDGVFAWDDISIEAMPKVWRTGWVGDVTGAMVVVPLALASTVQGGTVVLAGIHMSDIPSFPYEILWGERVLRSVANLTRADGEEFMEIAGKIPIHTHTVPLPLSQANEALRMLKHDELKGAAVLRVSSS